jgi:uncharacterized membrane protein YkoI
MRARVLVFCSFVLGLPVSVAAQGAPRQPAVVVKEEQPGLLARATVSPDSATRMALARVPSARVAKAEIEMEHRKLVYSFDLAVTGKPGVEEVLVDATTGVIISVEHEDDPPAPPTPRKP